MRSEVIQVKKCPADGREVRITLLYQLEGTRTCQVVSTPLSWRCSAEKHCRNKSECSFFKDFLNGS